MKQGSLAAVYDEFARTYDSRRLRFDLTEVLTDFRGWLPRRGRLLDLGCGAGEPVAADFVSRGWQVTGVDFSEAMLQLCGEHVPEVTRIGSDMREVAFPDDSFEAITAVYSLFHVPWPQHSMLFSCMRRWLVPDGAALFTYATRAYTGHDRFTGTKDFMGRELFYSHTRPVELHDQLHDAGLDVVDARDRDIGGETFLWVTVTPATSGSSTPPPQRSALD